MIKKLRWRFISASMLAFFLVIALIAVLVNVAYYCVETNRIDNTIDSIVSYDPYQQEFKAPGRFGGKGDGNGNGGGGRGRDDSDGKSGMEPFRALPDEEANYMTRFFIVAVGSDGTFLYASMDFVATVDESEAVDYTISALEKKSDRGYINGYRYARIDAEDATVVVFLNCAKELRTMNSVLYMTLAISGTALILVFLQITKTDTLNI